MDLSIVGPGRLGRSLAMLLEAAGHRVHLRGREATEPPFDPDLRLLTVPDPAIAEVAASLPPGAPVVHCAGSKGLDVLAPHARRGSLHPLMSFPGPEVALPSLDGVPAAIDATDEALAAALTTLAEDLGLTPVRVPGDRRLYHAAAVMAGNFATVLLAEAGAVLEAAGVESRQARALLLPLMEASLRQAVADPARGLTGPIPRRDQATLEAHRAALREVGQPARAQLHAVLTERAERLLDPTKKSFGDPGRCTPKTGD